MRYLFALFMLLIPSLATAGELISSHVEREALGGGKYRTTISSAPIAYQEAGQWKRIVSNWTDGDAENPQIVSTAKLRVRSAPDGQRRILPVPGDDTKWVSIGAPLVQNASNDWIKPTFTGPVRSGNKLTWTNASAQMVVTHLGHGIKLDIELLNGYVPRNSKFAFPVGINGLTRSGSQILDGSTVVMLLRAPVVYDAANPQDVRPIAWQFVNGNIVFTLPSLVGMTRPVVDPTVTLQPDGTDGVDTFIYGPTPATNYEINIKLAVGEVNNTADAVYRSLVNFNLSSIPATFTSATLQLFLTDDFSDNARTFQIYPLTQAWTEAGSTWATYNGVNGWPGGAGAAGDVGAAIGSCSMAAIEVGGWKTFMLTPTTKAGLGSLGWLIKADTESNDSHFFASSDNATVANRPKLVIEYRSGSGILLGP